MRSEKVHLKVKGKEYWYYVGEYRQMTEYMRMKECELVPPWLFEFLENPISKDRSHDLVITNIYEEKKKETI